MKSIYKYQLSVIHFEKLSLPEGAEILDIQYQDDKLMLWALVDTPVTKQVKRTFQIFGTGQAILPANRKYLKTVQDGAFVWHVFEVLS